MQVLGGGCRVIEPDEGHWQEHGTRSWRETIGAAIRARDITQTLSRFGPGLSAGHCNPASEQVHYVLEGEGACYIDGFRYAIEAGSAIYVAPGSQWCVRTEGPTPLRMVSVCCPSIEEARHDLAPLTQPARPGDQPPRRVVHERDCRAIPMGIRMFKVLADTDLGCQRVTQFIGVVPPSEAPPHYHTYEETIYIIEGRGLFWAEGDEAPIGPGSCIYLPRGVSHSTKNTGDVAIRLLGVFHPSGSPAANYPSQRD